MIRVTIELLPGGLESRKRHLGTAEIANDGTGTTRLGNYRARLSRKGSPNSTWKTARITGFPRKKFGPWDLLLWVLVDAVGPRLIKRKVE